MDFDYYSSDLYTNVNTINKFDDLPYSYNNYNYNYKWRNNDDDDEYKKKKKEAKIKRREFLSLGLSGFENFGNTCYLSSTLQLLINCPYIQTILRGPVTNLKLKNDTNRENTLTFNICKLAYTAWNNNVIIKPKTIKKFIGENHNTLAGYGQQDSQEALQFILDHLHEDTCKSIIDLKFPTSIIKLVEDDIQKIKECSKIIEESKDMQEKIEASNILMKLYKKNPNKYLIMLMMVQWKELVKNNGISLFSYLLWGSFCSKKICEKCEFVMPTFDMFNMIQLTIPENNTYLNKDLTLHDCLKHHFRSEIIERKCNKCEHNKSKQESFVYTYPKILFIHLKRFESSYSTYSGLTSKKRNDKISFPIKGLKFKENSIDTEGIDIEKIYDLNGIVEHRGTIDCGHYVSYCKNTITDEWFEFNDDKVLRIPKDELKNEILTDDAYLLMYTQRDDVIIDDDNN